MINILNLNPSIDYFVTIDEFSLNKTNYSIKENILLGGKGSNIGVLLNNFNVESVMHGFIGGFVGEFIKVELSKLTYVRSEMIDTEMLSRINIKLNYEGETEINGAGKVIPESFIKKLEKGLNNLGTKDILVMSGKVANGMSYSWYKKIAEQMNRQDVDFIIDVNDRVILEILKYKPLLLKPNKDELINIFSHQGDLNDNNLIYYGNELIQRGAQHVIISIGSEGSFFFFKDKIYKSKNIEGVVQSAVGAGDSMIAGFLSKYERNGDPLNSYRFAQACGNVTALSKGIADKEDVDFMISQVEIIEIYDEIKKHT